MYDQTMTRLPLREALKNFARLNANGFYLRYGNVGWEWLPTDALLDEWIKNGEIG